MCTEDALILLTKTVYSDLDKSLPTSGVFLDLRKAFDTVHHDLLLRKLEILGFRGTVFKLMESYLKNRLQRVTVNKSISSIQSVQFGVPQGTVMGPILFLIYINDLLSYDTINTYISYADDTVILINGNTWEELRSKMIITLKKIKFWLDVNLLTLNWEKTKCLPFCVDSRTKPQFNGIILHKEGCNVGKLTCDCENKIDTVEETKYLGIILDTHLRFEKHVQYIAPKLRKTIFILRKLKGFMSKENLKMIYYALFHSVWQYGSIAWGTSYETTINLLEILQKKAIKIILNKKSTYPTDLLYNEIDVLNLRKTYIQKLLQKIYNDKNLLTFVNCLHYSTRQTVKLIAEIPIKSKRISQKCITYMAAKIFNELPLSIKTCKIYYKYTKNCKNWLRSISETQVKNWFA